MDNRAEVREFLTTRRARITPAQAGLPDVGHRRVPGLRRIEVAALAGVSIEYYAKLERGALAGVSPQVIDAITSHAIVTNGRHDLLATNLLGRAMHGHNVRIHGTGTKHFHHDAVGALTMAYETMALNAEPGLALTIYTAEPASATAQALTLLGTWAATQLQTTAHPS